MGGSVGGIFSNVGQGANGAGSFLQNLVQGTVAGAGKGFGQSTKPPAPGGSGSQPSAPAAAPVDPRYFMPTALPPRAPAGAPMSAPSPGGGSAFYGPY